MQIPPINYCFSFGRDKSCVNFKTEVRRLKIKIFNLLDLYAR